MDNNTKDSLINYPETQKWKLTTSKETLMEYEIPWGYKLDAITMIVKDENGKEIEFELQKGIHYKRRK